MTGQDFQDKLDAIVLDLQTAGKGKVVKMAFRGADNDTFDMILSSDVNGVVDAAQLAAIQAQIDNLKPLADALETESAPVKAASEAFTTAREVHRNLIDAATDARVALSAALEADQGYQNAKTTYDTARQDPDYVAARTAYKSQNVSENFGNLSDSRGKYLA